MKQLIILFTLLSAIIAQTSASTLTTYEGKILFAKGDYQLITEQNTVQLVGLTNQQLRHYEGRTVKVAGEKTMNRLEVYKVFVKTEEGFETSYDWDIVNQDLYLD